MMESVSDPEAHAIFKIDPAEWMQYVHKCVTVTTTKGSVHRGWVYTVDPVSQTIALVEFSQDGAIHLDMVIGHAIKSIFVTNSDTKKHKAKLEKLFQPEEAQSVSPAELKEKKSMVMSWLNKNRIPVTVSGDSEDILNISDALFIEPPYGVKNCRSTNEIILGRVQGLIKSMPSDVKDW